MDSASASSSIYLSESPPDRGRHGRTALEIRRLTPGEIICQKREIWVDRAVRVYSAVDRAFPPERVCLSPGKFRISTYGSPAGFCVRVRRNKTGICALIPSPVACRVLYCLFCFNLLPYMIHISLKSRVIADTTQVKAVLLDAYASLTHNARRN
jgi:hypothetical protein